MCQILCVCIYIYIFVFFELIFLFDPLYNSNIIFLTELSTNNSSLYVEYMLVIISQLKNIYCKYTYVYILRNVKCQLLIK